MNNLISYEFFLTEKWIFSSKSDKIEEYKEARDKIFSNKFASFSDKFKQFVDLKNSYMKKNPNNLELIDKMDKDFNYFSILINAKQRDTEEKKAIYIYNALRRENLSDIQRQKLLNMLPKYKNKE